MAIISLSITETSEQLVAGIPKAVYVETNVPALIFYTLDGSDPTVSSYQYIDKITFPNINYQVILKIMATDGVNYSPIITETYSSNMLQNTRYPHSTTTNPPETTVRNLYPFGTNPYQPTGTYINPSGITVNDPTLTQIPNGYDVNGNPINFTNLPYTLENYNIQYSTTDAEGERTKGVGTMPAEVTIITPLPPPEESYDYTSLFDPRAMVVYQDVSKENPNDPPHINSEYFSFSNNQEDPTSLYNSGLEAATTMGSFVNYHYNARTNEITYYYLDTHSCKWLISTAPYQQIGDFTGNLSGIFTSRISGSAFVFSWEPYMRRSLF